MFTDLGLNISRQADNGANPRPDNRSGWLDGETPDVVEDYLDTLAEADGRGHQGHDLGPGVAAALRQEGQGAAAPRRRAEPLARRRGARSGRAAVRHAVRPPRAPRAVSDIEARLEELRELGALPAHAPRQRAAGLAGGARRPAGPAVVLQQLPRPRRPPAGARGRGRRGDALGRRRRRVAAGLGDDDRPPPARGGAGRVQGHRVGGALRLGLPGQPRRDRRWRARRRRRRRVVFSDELNHASIIDGCRLARAETFVYDHCDVEHLAWGLRQHARPRRGA